MECKMCRVEMRCEARPDLTTYVCPECGGSWFNGGEMEVMIAERIDFLPGSRHEDPEQAGDDAPDECPACGHGVRLVGMTTHVSPAIRVLGCPVCFGRWLTRRQALALIRHVCYRGPMGWVRKKMAKG